MAKLLSRVAAVVLVGAAAMSSAAESNADLASQVRETERAFAKTMADRDHAAFTSFLSEEAVFLSSKGTLRGRKAVAEGWKRPFDGPRAPFAWEPERIEVLDSGTLALSTGPVYDPEGKRVGTFTSTWRREARGKWRIVLDSGCPPCQCPEPAAK
jgi:ketosteroid isomerase-like protein